MLQTHARQSCLFLQRFYVGTLCRLFSVSLVELGIVTSSVLLHRWSLLNVVRSLCLLLGSIFLTCFLKSGFKTTAAYFNDELIKDAVTFFAISLSLLLYSLTRYISSLTWTSGESLLSMISPKSFSINNDDHCMPVWYTVLNFICLDNSIHTILIDLSASLCMRFRHFLFFALFASAASRFQFLSFDVITW